MASLREHTRQRAEPTAMGDAEAVRLAVLKFYQALDDLLCSKGTATMFEIWAHESHVSTVHPFGHWANGWEEVWASWQETAAVFSYYRGHIGRTEAIGTIDDLKITLLGDVAFCVGVYRSTMYFPDHPRPLSVNCTNILVRSNDGWKMVHHHADQANGDYQRALARMVEDQPK